MKLAITTYNYFSIFDTENNSKRIIDKNKGKYFGISWDNSFLYVTVGVRLNLGEQYGQKTEKVLVFDKNFKLLGDLFKKDVGLINIHQILVKDGILWMANSGKNRIDKYYFKTKKIKHWYPFFFKRGSDINHFNTILIKKNLLYLLAHNNQKPSIVLIYNYPKINLVKKIIIGKQSHNLYLEDDEIYVCDSLGTVDVISNKGNKIPIGKNYIRGLAASDNRIFVGTSKKASRVERQKGDCEIHEFDRITKAPLNIYKIEDAGNIYDIRILDEFDYCHGIKPFSNK